jgi:hypothetical protein
MVRANRQVDYERVPFLEDGDRSFHVISVRMAHPCRNMPCVPAPKTIVTESLHSADTLAAQALVFLREQFRSSYKLPSFWLSGPVAEGPGALMRGKEPRAAALPEREPTTTSGWTGRLIYPVFVMLTCLWK